MERKCVGMAVAVFAAWTQVSPGRAAEPAKDGNKMAIDNDKTVFDFSVKDMDGADVPLSKYRGNVCLIVNVASL